MERSGMQTESSVTSCSPVSDSGLRPNRKCHCSLFVHFLLSLTVHLYFLSKHGGREIEREREREEGEREREEKERGKGRERERGKEEREREGTQKGRQKSRDRASRRTKERNRYGAVQR